MYGVEESQKIIPENQNSDALESF
ncbi:hypothetical protein PM8797T_28079 [Gimesia maris DSM 8797]|nr:hypothetical protein PM8797T_28079 [Gimesia maris DSM 8797]